jgi:allantoinase
MDVGDFMSAWGGIASVQLGLPSFWTCARERDISIDQLIRLLCWNTAKQVGLDKVKGKIAAGFDADITVWDPDNTFTVPKETNICT